MAMATATQSYIDFESFDDGEIAIYRRRDNKVPTYQARILAPGTAGYVIRSARTSNRDDAYAFAKQLRDDLKFRHRMGENVKSRQAKTVISEYLKSQASHSRFENTRVAIGKHFNAFVGNKTMDAIDTALIEDYFEERKKVERYGRKLASSTLNAEGGEIRRFLKWAVDRKYIQRIPDFKKVPLKTRARPAFDRTAYERLTRNARHWVNQAEHSRVRRDRVLLWNYVLILANTGIRVGEARNLQWRDIFQVGEQDGKPIIGFRVDGKTGVREVIARTSEVRTYLDRIRQLRVDDLGENPSEESFIFCHPDGSPIGSFKKGFASLIKHCNVEFDRDGNRRTLYSLRHTYATLRLYEGVNHYALAQNMGTSVEMIEKHYGHTSTVAQAGELMKTQQRKSGSSIFDFITS